MNYSKINGLTRTQFVQQYDFLSYLRILVTSAGDSNDEKYVRKLLTHSPRHLHELVLQPASTCKWNSTQTYSYLLIKIKSNQVKTKLANLSCRILQNFPPAPVRIQIFTA